MVYRLFITKSLATQFFLLLVFGSLAPLLGQMSPGPLSRAHSNLDGPLNCAKCHAFGIGRAEFRCLDCHKEIDQEIVRP